VLPTDISWLLLQQVEANFPRGPPAGKAEDIDRSIAAERLVWFWHSSRHATIIIIINHV
jgi:hypothetical protein